jgi:RNA polymerase sigma-70 factor, ECF subfamily
MLSKTVAGGAIEPALTFSSLKSLSDEVLMAHIEAGDGDALAVVFDRYHRLVFNVAFKILRNAAEAEDVLQTVFMEIYCNAVQFNRAKGTIKMWLLQYAYHRSFNRKRYLNVRSFEHTAEFVVAEKNCPEEFFLNSGSLNLAERRLLVRQALGTLSEYQRRTLELAFFQGLSTHEISERTGESVGNVRHHYYRGLSKLRTLLHTEPVQQQAESLVARKAAKAEA